MPRTAVPLLGSYRRQSRADDCRLRARQETDASASREWWLIIGRPMLSVQACIDRNIIVLMVRSVQAIVVAVAVAILIAAIARASQA